MGRCQKDSPPEQHDRVQAFEASEVHQIPVIHDVNERAQSHIGLPYVTSRVFLELLKLCFQVIIRRHSSAL
jgi:hypothetical protein